MATVSLCMIVKNEEKVLGRCLDSIADLMDEIVIVDTGSTDRTRRLQQSIQRKYMISGGLMIFLRLGILLPLKLLWSIYILRMPTRCWMRKTGSVSGI